VKAACSVVKGGEHSAADAGGGVRAQLRARGAARGGAAARGASKQAAKDGALFARELDALPLTLGLPAKTLCFY
jgi:hypothetical protein